MRWCFCSLRTERSHGWSRGFPVLLLYSLSEEMAVKIKFRIKLENCKRTTTAKKLLHQSGKSYFSYLTRYYNLVALFHIICRLRYCYRPGPLSPICFGNNLFFSVWRMSLKINDWFFGVVELNDVTWRWNSALITREPFSKFFEIKSEGILYGGKGL